MPTLSHQEKEYIIFCDESDRRGPFFSNFYGGVIVGGSKWNQVSQRLEQAKQDANILSEVKWEKVSPFDVERYELLVRAYFDELAAGSIRTRIMFTQNLHVPRNLTPIHHRDEYFILYYNFLKHGFGLRYMPIHPNGARLRFYLDQLPDQSNVKKHQFRGFIGGLANDSHIRRARLAINEADIAEVNSKDHILLQCTDVILGAMSFRLNDKHKAKLPGSRLRGKRTVAKERLYKFIFNQIRRVSGKKAFNIGISTGVSNYPMGRWMDPYLHWRFVSKEHEVDSSKGKRK